MTDTPFELEIPPAAPTTRPRRASTKTSPAPRAKLTIPPTASRMRLGGDHPVWFVFQVVTLVGVILSALTISASALIVVGGWQQTPDMLDPLTITMIDLPMLAAFVSAITFKWRGYSGWLFAARFFGGTMTLFSAAMNFLYTVSKSAEISGGTGLDTYQEITGAIVHAAAPILVFFCFEFFGQIITRPKRNATRLSKLTHKELQKVEKELKKRIADAAKIEKKELLG